MTSPEGDAPLPPAHVTLTRVAAAAGVSVATASYSLRDDPLIPRATAARVQAVARRLGYRPNPRVSALMAHIRRAKPVTAGERIAFLWVDAPPGERPYGAVFEGAARRAAQLGYAMEEFWRAAPGITDRRLEQILRTRGIVGVLISPSIRPDPRFRIAWDWGFFSPVVIGTAESTPELHHAAHHHYGGMRLAMLRLQAEGKRRIVGLLDRRLEERARRAWSAAFLAHHPLGEKAWDFLIQEVPIPEGVPDLPGRIRQRRPDAIVAYRTLVENLLERGWKPPAKTEVVLLNWFPNRWGLGGIDQCEEVIATNAVDLVAGQLQRNERGIPKDVKMVLSAGRWVSRKAARA